MIRIFATLVAGLLTLGSLPASAGWFSGNSAPTAPAISPATIDQIKRALDEERYIDASSLLDQTLVGNGSDPNLILLTGKLHLAMGRYSDALTSFKSIDSDPGVHAAALQGEGVSLCLLGRGA